MTVNDIPSPEALRALLAYDPATGALIWRRRNAETLAAHGLDAPDDLGLWNERHAGADACHGDDGRGYLVVRIDGRRYRPSGWPGPCTMAAGPRVRCASSAPITAT